MPESEISWKIPNSAHRSDGHFFKNASAVGISLLHKIALRSSPPLRCVLKLAIPRSNRVSQMTLSRQRNATRVALIQGFSNSNQFNSATGVHFLVELKMPFFLNFYLRWKFKITAKIDGFLNWNRSFNSTKLSRFQFNSSSSECNRQCLVCIRVKTFTFARFFVDSRLMFADFEENRFGIRENRRLPRRFAWIPKNRPRVHKNRMKSIQNP